MRYKKENDNRYRVNFMIATEKLMDQLTVKEFELLKKEAEKLDGEIEDLMDSAAGGKLDLEKAFEEE